MALNVDDGLIIAKTVDAINTIINALSKSFDITVEKTSVFVGLEIERDHKNKSMLIHQHSYIDIIIARFEMTDSRLLSVPADPHTILRSNNENDNFDLKVPYQEAVESLSFLAIVSRPDICQE